MTLIAIADTHGYHFDLDIPPGDILIHAGDLTQRGTLTEVSELNEFLGELPHKHKVVIAGNHDFCFQHKPRRARARLTNAHYLEDQPLVLKGVRFYGSPWQPWFWDWAFNLRRGPEIAAKWALIPETTDVLITHGPPAGIGDRTSDGRSVGCEDLLRRVQEIRPRFHIFGHIHDAPGVWTEGETTFVNATTNEGDHDPIVLRY